MVERFSAFWSVNSCHHVIVFLLAMLVHRWLVCQLDTALEQIDRRNWSHELTVGHIKVVGLHVGMQVRLLIESLVASLVRTLEGFFARMNSQVRL